MLTFGAALFLFASLHNTKKDTTRSLRRTSCSGAFVLLDATVNTRMEGGRYSRAGLYVQKGGADTPPCPCCPTANGAWNSRPTSSRTTTAG